MVGYQGDGHHGIDYLWTQVWYLAPEAKVFYAAWLYI
jgi:hypothetical protein